ncbi:hypothetical protein EJ06DRAFT_62966 [Trichodelitschia bisporula]|uniref:Uncharacterized protein n=1 Tax=Trichodelitschia bisporula TaxID=703511 RepID=A0A6G1HUH8_9PEZI|nr:hypothetical protein EJ06DRAFT_62966 [Trichodelitschia bisporula]
MQHPTAANCEPLPSLVLLSESFQGRAPILPNSMKQFSSIPTAQVQALPYAYHLCWQGGLLHVSRSKHLPREPLSLETHSFISSHQSLPAHFFTPISSVSVPLEPPRRMIYCTRTIFLRTSIQPHS